MIDAIEIWFLINEHWEYLANFKSLADCMKDLPVEYEDGGPVACFGTDGTVDVTVSHAPNRD